MRNRSSSLRVASLLPLAALWIGSPSIATAGTAAPSISITALPDYGATGSIAGRIEGIDPALNHVATYLYVDGVGWWTKPTEATPTVPIAPDLGTPSSLDGTFSALVTTGGVDTSAILYCVGVLPANQSPPLASGAVRVPDFAWIAFGCAERAGREIEFAGRRWGVKEAPLPVGPGDNRFSLADEDAFVDAGGKLHLTIHQHGDAWFSTEVFLLAPLGYGTYELTTESDLASLAADVTFGAFTWDSFGDASGAGKDPNRELDFEASRWGDALDPTNAQAVVQPYGLAGNLERFTIGAVALRWRMDWLPDRVEFEVLDGEDAIYHWSYDGASTPDAGRAVLHLNLWRNQPTSGPAEVVIGDFEYTPEPIAAASGLCAFASLVLLRRWESSRADC